MEAQRKTIQTLTVLLDEKRVELNNRYAQFGARLFTDSSDPNRGGPIDASQVETWRSLMDFRERDTASVLAIRGAVARQQELTRFTQELDSTMGAERAKYREQLGALGRLYFQTFPDDESEGLALMREQIGAAEDALNILEGKHRALMEEIRTAGFFAKLAAQFRVPGLASSMRQARTRLDSLYGDCMEKLIARGSLEGKMRDGRLQGSFGELFSLADKTGNRLKELGSRLQGITAENAALSDTLASHGALESPSRRLGELQGKIRETDKRTDALLTLAAREYADKFIDDNGHSVLGGSLEGNAFSDMGPYSHQLEGIAAYRSEISLLRRRIELLETELRIVAIDTRLQAWNRGIADHEAKIKRHQDMIGRLRSDIADGEAEREKLATHKSDLEASLQ